MLAYCEVFGDGQTATPEEIFPLRLDRYVCTMSASAFTAFLVAYEWISLACWRILRDKLQVAIPF